MFDFEKLGAFYLGKTEQGPLLLDAKDLVTHAVCVGMTGSGKTGLCLGLLEEAAIDGIPALIIDPKGDLANLLLTFPNLAPADFLPWVNEDTARQKGVSKEQFAADTAAKWKEGLGQWGQDGNRIQKMRDAADFTIYTPGSNAGVPISVLRSFSVPSAAILDDREALRERIQSTATALLSLLNFTGDPIQSREHILISKLIETSWSNGSDLDIATLIQQIQKPPITRIGVLELESFFPAKERFDLAISLNNLLASPGFEAWMEGVPLDISSLLYTPAGKPRMAIMSIAHLSDAERMFFVALLLNQVVSWMRTQSGTTTLRALVYMDEIFGYFPPTANPPSKLPLLTLLKQARAFGVGVVLATQNPVDLDYKGLANCGTWLIGRLQTERDKQRLVDGLQGAASQSGSPINPAALDQLLSSLKSRIFLMSNVHRGGLEVFETRWCMSYLAGPLTKSQIKTLTQAKPAAAASAAAPPPPPVFAAPAASPRPVLPPDVEQHFLPYRGQGPAAYHPVLMGAATTRYTDTKTKIDFSQDVAFLTPLLSGPVPVDWQRAEAADLEPGDLEAEPHAQATYEDLPAPASKAKSYPAWSKDFANYLFASQKLELYRSKNLGLVSMPGESERDFRIRLNDAAHAARDQAVSALRQKYTPKLMMLEERIRKAQQVIDRESQQASAAKVQTGLSIASGILGAFLGRGFNKSTVGAVGTAARSMGRASKESSDVARAEENLQAAEQQKADLEQQLQEEITTMQMKFDALNEPLETTIIAPKKTNITVKFFSLCWRPE
jgi:hypothetical protein